MTIHMQFGNESIAIVSRWPLNRSYNVIIYDVITGQENVYGNNFAQKSGTAMGEVSLCLSCDDTSTDMQFTYLDHSSGRVIWPDLRTHFKIDLFVSRFICFDEFRRGEYDGASVFFYLFTFIGHLQKEKFKKYLQKRLFYQNAAFLVWYLPWTGQNVI